MVELLNDYGVPVSAVATMAALFWLIRRTTVLVMNQRAKLATDVYGRVMAELDQQIELFYLPVREYLAITNELFITGNKWRDNAGRYLNATAGVVSDDPQALRNIVVRRIYAPLNSQLKDILLERQHLRRVDDDTDYRAILKHLILWEAFESAKTNREIASYHAEELLTFPVEEAKKQASMTDTLLQERSSMRERIVRFRKLAETDVDKRR